MKKISLVLPCYNEEENINELYERLIKVVSSIKNYEFEFIFIDNSSQDKTVEKLKEIVKLDKRAKIIVNYRNFGHIRSPYWGMLQASGDAVVIMASDLQDPPELIPSFLLEWERGWKIVLATKPYSKTSLIMHSLRRIYYTILDGIADVSIIKNATGYGLYDRIFVNKLKETSDPYPYIRGLVCEFGFPVKTIDFLQPKRVKGLSKNNFYTLFDIGMLGMVTHSLVPIRVTSFIGFLLSALSFLVALVYFILKLIYWDSFIFGVAPIMIGMFFFFGVLFIALGLIGEYVGSIHTYVKNRPIVVEKERINFD